MGHVSRLLQEHTLKCSCMLSKNTTMETIFVKVCSTGWIISKVILPYQFKAIHLLCVRIQRNAMVLLFAVKSVMGP